MPLFEPIFAALENGAVRYVVVGGMATVLHGYARLTADVDLILLYERSQIVALATTNVALPRSRI